MNERGEDLSQLSLFELFRVETENQAAVLTNGLLALERDPGSAALLDELMRAAHSLKGAARIVNLEPAVSVAHALEDCFVAAKNGAVALQQPGIDLVFQGIDLLLSMGRQQTNTSPTLSSETCACSEALVRELDRVAHPGTEPPVAVARTGGDLSVARQVTTAPLAVERVDEADRMLRLTAENLDRLLGLAGESLVESRWLHPFSDSLLRLKRLQTDVAQAIEVLREDFHQARVGENFTTQLANIQERFAECRELLADRLTDLDMFDRRSANLSHRLYRQVLQCRMRPFMDGVQSFPRMVRDLARKLGKEARLEISGGSTQVDRDILERLDAPLVHLLRNAVDHGCETPEERLRTGKPAQGTIRLEARHSAGMLVITVADDGPGVSLDQLRETIARKRLAPATVIERLNETELLAFLLLPGFSLRDTVTEFSGRGVGLDVVQNMVKTVRGTVRISTEPGRGMRFQLHLPLTLSVLRGMLVEISGEPYAIPLATIARALKVPRAGVLAVEGRPTFNFDGRQVGLVSARQILEDPQPAPACDPVPVVVLGDRSARFGLAVDAFLGERELVVQPLDPRLKKIPNVSAGSLMEDGSPVLILDPEDMVHSIEKLVTNGLLDTLPVAQPEHAAARVKRILAVDDSLTVRELQRKLLGGRGYVVDLAVDGMDAWNAVRGTDYDLVITDVDMPRMDGVELATLIKQEARLRHIPVMIVSYKDREEDRLRGLEAGADYYLTKGNFHDETLLQAVCDLIGKPDE